MPLFGPNIEKMRASEDTSGLLAVLSKHSDPGMRQQAADALAALQTDAALEGLVRLLHEEDAEAIRLAAQTLARCDGLHVAQALWTGAVYPEQAHEAVVWLVAQIGPQAQPSLLAVLEAGKPYGLVMLAARCLEQVGDARAVEPLALAIDAWRRKLKLMPGVPEAADTALLALRARGVPIEPRAAVMWGAHMNRWDVIEEQGAQAAGPLLAFLISSGLPLGPQAAALLARHPAPGAEDYLRDRLRSGAPDEIRQALLALGGLGAASAVQAILGLVSPALNAAVSAALAAILGASAAQVSDEDLRAISGLQDESTSTRRERVVSVLGETETVEETTVIADFAQARELAQRELARRGSRPA